MSTWMQGRTDQQFLYIIKTPKKDTYYGNWNHIADENNRNSILTTTST
jgi:hypothetical protein